MEHRKEKRMELAKTLILTTGNACELKDISKSGLSFQCAKEVAWPEEWHLDIITTHRDFDILNCPVELIWKKTETGLDIHSRAVKNVGVRFSDLSKSQQEKLDLLLSMASPDNPH